MHLLRITRAELPRYQAELEALEHESVYPLGDDAFRISHGADYFAFFERLGRVEYFAMQDPTPPGGGAPRIAGVGCVILRPEEDGVPPRWYASDVKVHPDYRGQHVVVKMLYRGFLPLYARCRRGYAIAMDPADGRVPPAVRSMQHYAFLPKFGTDHFRLALFSVDAARMEELLPLVAKVRPDRRARFVSTAGIKDLVLESTKKHYPLLHLTFSDRPAPRVYAEPQADHVHMWCLPTTHALVAELEARGVRPSATATVIKHRLPTLDGTKIDTSEI